MCPCTNNGVSHTKDEVSHMGCCGLLHLLCGMPYIKGIPYNKRNGVQDTLHKPVICTKAELTCLQGPWSCQRVLGGLWAGAALPEAALLLHPYLPDPNKVWLMNDAQCTNMKLMYNII